MLKEKEKSTSFTDLALGFFSRSKEDGFSSKSTKGFCDPITSKLSIQDAASLLWQKALHDILFTRQLTSLYVKKHFFHTFLKTNYQNNISLSNIYTIWVKNQFVILLKL